MKAIPLEKGAIYTNLTVIGCFRSRKDNRRYWKLGCSCGNIVKTSSNAVRSGAVKSCGCLRISTFVARNTTHGKSKFPEHKIWENMISRCTCKNAPYYKHYGGRGIRVCKRWMDSFEVFLEDMGPRPSEKHELDRFPNNDGNYEPGNCRWATRRQQLNNKRNNHFLTIGKETKTIAEWSEVSGIDKSMIYARLKVGVDPKTAVFAKKYAQQRGEY